MKTKETKPLCKRDTAFFKMGYEQGRKAEQDIKDYDNKLSTKEAEA